jgi:hypothetical protein
MKRFAIIFVIILLSISDMYGQNMVKYYLAPKGSAKPDGSIKNPFSSFDQVQSAVRDRSNRKVNIQVIIRQGTYILRKPLIFTPADGGDSLHTVEYTAYKGEKVSITGGKTLVGVWAKDPNSNIWKLKITNYNSDKDVFRSLFSNSKRLPRASSDTLFSKGPIPKYASSYKFLDFPAIRRLAKDSLNVFCGFVYANNALDAIRDISGEVIAYNSWEASWHTIKDIDRINHIIHFKNPATFPVGFFSPKIRFRIENCEDYLDSPGEWLLKHDKGEVWYFAAKGENPNSSKFTVPIADTLLILKGNSKDGQLVRNVKFSNISFNYSASTWGAHRIAEADRKKNSENFPWLNFSEGFSSTQAAPDCGAAIYLEAANGCTFDTCTFSHLGNYSLWIGQFSTHNTISNCKIFDSGGGGIIIGFDVTGAKRKSWSDSKSPSFNQVDNCEIADCGKIFPSGVGIGIMQANHTTIKSNTIHDLPYTGISVGWTYDFSDNYTTYNTIDGNYIFEVMRTMADGAGIYTLGKQTGTKYTNNYIKNIYKSRNAIGSDNNGFFFDESSSDFEVDGNMVMNIQNADFRYNRADTTTLRINRNHFQKTRQDKDVKDRLLRKWKD